MATAFIAGLAVSLPSRFKEGDILDELSATILWEVQLRRIKARLANLIKKGDINADGIQAKALEINAQDLAPHATLDDDDSESDPVLEEALTMAKEIITQRMAEAGLPPPKGLDAHAKALVDGMPALQEKARQRVEARYKAAEAALRSMT